MNNFIIVKVNSDYCNYLRQFDNKVPYNVGGKDLRPFIGVLLEIDDMKYFAPLSSPKPKHLSMKNKPDLIKIDDGKLGVVNINNMIPVYDNLIKVIDLNKECIVKEEKQYNTLLKKQLKWLNLNKSNIYDKALKLYDKYVSGKLNNYNSFRCCDFKLLEEKCKEYNKTIKE